MNKNSKTVMAAETGKILYEESVVNRMDGRCGVTPQGAKGIAFEIMDIDQLNLKDALHPDRHTQMTKNPHAPQLDAITKENNVVVKRYQYKDTPAGTSKTIQQVKSGKYDQATLRGTKESAEAFNAAAQKAGINKRMESSGISSKDTKRVADKYLMLKDGSISPTAGENLLHTAKSSACGAAGLAATIEVGKSILNGDSVGTCASHVVSAGTESAVTAAATGAAGEIAFACGAMVNPALAVPAAIATSVLTAAVTGEAVDGEFDEVADAVGELADTVVDLAGDLIDTIGCFLTMLF